METKRKLLTVGQAAQELGLSPATLRAWIWRRKIEHTRIGRAVRIPSAVVDRLVERGTVPTLRS
jgi:excisionase family DNA binding protein